jgi:outer membrane beta-barrel protein
MRIRSFVPSLFAATLLAASLAHAQDQKPQGEQVIDPKVERRDVRVPKFPSNDFSISAFAGVFSTQDFGAHAVTGLRLGYHITEDFFAEAAYGRTKISDETYRLLLPGGGIFPTETVKVNYYNLSAGYNVLPGEIFIGRNIAKASQFFLIGGIGRTKVDDQSRQTINVGFGYRVFFTDRFSTQLDVRDHVFSLDLLGERKTMHNIEVTGGLSYYF